MAEQTQQRSPEFTSTVEALRARGYTLNEERREVIAILNPNGRDKSFKISDRGIVEVRYPETYEEIIAAQRFYDMCENGSKKIPVAVSGNSSIYQIKNLIGKLQKAVDLTEKVRGV